MLTSTKDALTRIIPGGDSSPVAVDPAAPLDIPIPDVVDVGAKIDTLDRAHTATGGPGAALRLARTAAADFRSGFAASGTVASVSTHDLITLPYPTKFGLWRAPASPVPFLFITNRLVVGTSPTFTHGSLRQGA
jgi:hypothetical protein